MLSKNVMSHRRAHVDIVAAILRLAKSGSRKTRIVYGANLNFKLLNEYLAKLEKAGLIAEDSVNSGVIRTTEKGKRFLQHYEAFREFGMP
ncbi:MAG: winged helix-turn-helix domain-containing protein [Candidatus Bathyarchaeia archaeon]